MDPLLRRSRTSFQGHDVQQWVPDNDIEWRFCSPWNPPATGGIERENDFTGTADVLVRKSSLAGQTKGLEAALTPPNANSTGLLC